MPKIGEFLLLLIFCATFYARAPLVIFIALHHYLNPCFVKKDLVFAADCPREQYFWCYEAQSITCFWSEVDRVACFILFYCIFVPMI